MHSYTDCFFNPQAINSSLVYCTVFHLCSRNMIARSLVRKSQESRLCWCSSSLSMFAGQPNEKGEWLTICIKRKKQIYILWCRFLQQMQNAPALLENIWSAVKSCSKIFPPKYSHARNFFPSIFNMAAAADERNRSLKQALIESLTAILSPDQQARQLAEEQLKVLEVTEGKIIFLL